MNDININLINVIGIISVVICILLALFLFTTTTKNKLSNRLFGAYLILIALDLTGFFSSLLYQSPSSLGMMKNLTSALQLPVFYLYVLSVCYSDFKLRVKHLAHLIPFIILNAILFPRYYSVDYDAKVDFIKNITTMVEIQATHIIIHLQVILYLIVIFLVLRRAKKLFLENYTNTSINSYKWLFQLTAVLAFFHTIAILKNIFKFTIYDAIYDWILLFMGICELIIICWYVLKALRHPDLFNGVNSKLFLAYDMVKTKKSEIETNDNQEITVIKQYMITEEPYLDPSLSIQDLSNRLNIPTKELSISINHKIGQHFFDFVNQYRIKKAMKILENPANAKLTVLEILYKVGFNSKSSFNTAFKKHTGTTPTLYRKTHS